MAALKVPEPRESSESNVPAVTTHRLVCQNDRFFVFLDELAYSGLPHVKDYLVVVPKQSAPNLVSGAAVLPVYEHKIGLIKTFRHAIRGESWEIPRGFVDEGETAAEAALRELEEETGLRCDGKGLRSLGFITPDAGILAVRVHLFAALQCTRTRPFIPGELGHREFRLFDSAEIEDMILGSEIQDPYTLVAYYNYATRL